MPVPSFLPAFEAYPFAAMIVGKLITGYGELEFEMARATAAATDTDTAVKAIFRPRGEEKRIAVADALMRQKYIAAGLETPYAETIGAMDSCRKIRNGYAHCHWIEEKGRLNLVQLERIVEKNTPIDFTKLVSVPVSDARLMSQEVYFDWVQRRFWFLGAEFRLRAGVESKNPFPMQPLMTAPSGE